MNNFKINDRVWHISMTDKVIRSTIIEVASFHVRIKTDSGNFFFIHKTEVNKIKHMPNYLLIK